MLDEVPPACDPLGPHNKLIFAPGLLTGYMLSSMDRISVGGKSPLTGGVKEANAGGTTALKMVWLKLHALVIEGGPPPNAGWQVLVVGQNSARFEAADNLANLGLKQTAQALLARYGNKIAISAIGPAGERLYRIAGITHIDQDRNLTRISARGGLGAVMGSKHLKAIVFENPPANKPPLVNSALFKDASRRYLQALRQTPQTSQVYTNFGTAAMVNLCNTLGGMPTRGFSAGNFEGAEAISGEAIRNLNLTRGGQPTHACMPGCVIRCSNVFAGADGKPLVTPLEYETIGLMGSNLGIDNPDIIAKLNDIANDMGMDAIDAGAALGIAAQAGLMRFGNGKSALALMEEVRQGTPAGRIIGSGAGLAAKILGVTRAPVVKNQAMPAYDPRAIKGTGVTYATSPQGADHTCGLTIRAQVEHSKAEGQAAVSRKAQYSMAGYDALGACIFGGFGFAADPAIVPDLINGRYAWGVGKDYLQQVGKETIKMERAFNSRAGFTAQDDRLPEWMTHEKLPPHNTVFDVPETELDAIFDKLD